MVAWHEVPGKPAKAAAVPEGRYERCLRFTNLNTSLVIFRRCPQSYRPYGTDHVLSFSQALRARLPSCGPSGTKSTLLPRDLRTPRRVLD